MIIILSFLINFSFAHVIKDDVTTTDKLKFSFQTVCRKMVTHESPLIEVASGTELDCMGKKVHVSAFCEKEMATDPYYLRAYVDTDAKEVVCQSGKKVMFKYLCVKLSDQDLCGREAKVACETIKQKLAKSLDTVHTSFTKNDKGIQQLNCYFEALPLKDRFSL